MNRADTKPLLIEIYRSALAAVAPGPALAGALEDEPRGGRIWVIALGKAAGPMADAAVRVLAARGETPAGGLVVAPFETPPPHPSIEVVVGDHPEPGLGSLASADKLEQLVTRVATGDTAWVLLSGGTTSLIGAPLAGIAPHELTGLYAQLLRSGLDIREMNRVRKRFTRWSGGRLARGLSRAARVACYIVSDVIGDDLAAIGSGPCVADPSTARDVRDTLVRAGLWDGLAPSLRSHLDDVERGRLPETPKSDDPAVTRVESRIVASNRLALEAAGRRAGNLGLRPDIVALPMVGEASAVGERIAELLAARAQSGQETGDDHPARCLILGGETTVAIRNQAVGLGGRAQELALAAARVLSGVALPVALLAAGTDGRDGPTDAAGAIVDTTTWGRIAAAGRNPDADLRGHDAYSALDAADALIRTGPTGTNVMDIVVGIG